MPRQALTEQQRAEMVAIYTSTAIGTPALGARFGVAAATAQSVLRRAGVDASRSTRAKLQFASGRATRAGAKWTEESRRRLSAARRGVAVTTGMRFSEESKARMSEARRRTFLVRPELREAAVGNMRAATERRRLPEEERAARDKSRRLAKQMLRRLLVLKNQRKDARTHVLLGYTAEQLRAHVEELFEKGMNWANRGSFHLDHVVPIREFLDRGITDVAVINALANLRPMRPRDNQSKSGAYAGDFQADLQRILQSLGREGLV